MKNQSEPGNIATTIELQCIKAMDNCELLVNLRDAHPTINCDYRRVDAKVNCVLVRKSVGDRLREVQKRLKKHDSKMDILVVEGYRSPFYQERYFLKQMLSIYKKDFLIDFDCLLDQTHHLVALPSVAGHPTGGAIDLTITYDGKEIDMLGSIADFNMPESLPTFSTMISPLQSINRKLLHDVMVAEGFAPFYGEWWHFSYGDLEWAAFYGLSESLYATIYPSFGVRGLVRAF